MQNNGGYFINLHLNVDTLTIDQLRDLIAAGDDSHHNQLRITSSREIFLSDIVGVIRLGVPPPKYIDLMS